MKKNKWLWYIAAVAVIVGLLSACTYGKAEYALNSDIPYTCIEYVFYYEDYEPDNWNNQTGTLLCSGERAFQIVNSLEELDTILARIEHFREQTSTENLTFDEAFFKNNSLLLIEVCDDPSVTTVARPEDLEEKNGKVTLTVKWGTDGASVAECGGSLLLIPISSDCTEADVAFKFTYWLGD